MLNISLRIVTTSFHRQHDTNATIYACKIGGCSFNSLRSDKYLEHMKRYHPTTQVSGMKNTSSPSKITSIKSDSSDTAPVQKATESFVYNTQNIVKFGSLYTTSTHLPSLHQVQRAQPVTSHANSQTETHILSVVPETSFPSVSSAPMSYLQNEAVISGNDLIPLDAERDNQSSPIPTKNVDTGSGRKNQGVGQSRNVSISSPVIGIIHRNISHHSISKEDSSSNESGTIQDPTGESMPTSLSGVMTSGLQLSSDKINGQNGSVSTTGNSIEGFNEIQGLKLATKFQGGCVYENSSLQVLDAVTATSSSTENRSSRLAKNVFNTISPPNKTVTDALTTFSDTPPVPLEEPSVFAGNPEEGNLFSHHTGEVTELDDVVDSVISNPSSSFKF